MYADSRDALYSDMSTIIEEDRPIAENRKKKA